MTTLSYWIASPVVTLLSGLLVLVLIWATKRHRDQDGRIARQRVATAFLLGCGLQSFASTLFLHWAFGIPMDQIMRDAYGERIAWVMLGASADFFLRVYELLDPGDLPRAD